MGRSVGIDEMADAIMETLEDYAELAAADVKQAVRDAGDTVRDGISAHAPRDTGGLRKKLGSEENEGDIFQPDPDRPFTEPVSDRASFGAWARETWWRMVPAYPHIAPAEQKGVEQLEDEIRKALEG